MPTLPAPRWMFRIGLAVFAVWTLAAIIGIVAVAGPKGQSIDADLVPYICFAWLIGSVVMAFTMLLLALRADDPK